jgi:hypothetical protein
MIASLFADVRFRQFEHRGSHPIACGHKVVGSQNEALGEIGTVLWPTPIRRAFSKLSLQLLVYATGTAIYVQPKS